MPANFFIKDCSKSWVESADAYAVKRMRGGFTFIEVLLVVSLLSMTGLVLYKALANGVKVWERGQQFVAEEDGAIFLDKISQELRGILKYSDLQFEGRSNRLKFTAPVLVKAEPKMGLPAGTLLHQMGRVEYYFDSAKGTIYRRQANYGQALQKRTGPAQAIAKSIYSLRFRYYYFNTEGLEEEADSLEVIPSAVQIELTLKDDKGLRSISRYVNVPAGG